MLISAICASLSCLAIVDAVDIKAERFQNKLANDTGVNVVAEHKADDNYIEVSAASTIAFSGFKLERIFSIPILSISLRLIPSALILSIS